MATFAVDDGEFSEQYVGCYTGYVDLGPLAQQQPADQEVRGSRRHQHLSVHLATPPCGWAVSRIL